MVSDPSGSPTGLFADGAAKAWTIPAGVDFLGALANTLAKEYALKSNPDALADALIYVPNRRSARALVLALFKAAGGVAILPPDVRALGDLENDEPPHGADEALTDLGPALSSSERVGTLALLVSRYYEKENIDVPATSIIAAARELSRLLDSAALAGVDDWSALPDLVADTELATHWEKSVKFLEIVTQAWPDWLAENNATEPFTRRMIVAETIADILQTKRPDTPVIIAGSTGATPATRAMMKAIATLPKGLIVLPALDHDASPDMWTEITPRTDGIEGEPDHPQFSLARTLSDLRLSAEQVPVWPGDFPEDASRARAKLIHESLTPAGQTANWLDRLSAIAAPESEADFAIKALGGLSIIEAEDEANEALIAALLLRESLETPDQTTAFVTPDATLARQVVALLKRWGLDIPPSAGVPLARTQIGSLCLLALEWARDTGHPVALVSLLKHPALGSDKRAVAALETGYLRGPRGWGTIDDLVTAIPAITEAKRKSRHTRLPDGTDALALSCLLPLQTLAHDAAMFANDEALIQGPVAIEALVTLIDKLVSTQGTVWTGRDGQAASQWLQAGAQIIAPLGPITPDAFGDIMTSLAGSATVPTDAEEHPRLSIWGPLEARLQHADRFVLGGLNEGVWPESPAIDGFLPRRFRTDLGLPAPEERLGLSAHDFAQLATAPNVTLLYSARREDAPAVPSRWLLRLKTLCEGALGKEAASAHFSPCPEHDPRNWAEHLTRDIQTFRADAAKPAPNPPVETRPERLSVTRIDTLQRDPYTIYAGDILRLKKLSALNEPPGVRERGTAIHKALEIFDEMDTGEQTEADLHALILRELRAAGEAEHLILAKRATYLDICKSYLEWWRGRQPDIANMWAEVHGELHLSIADRPFKLSGQADRLEKLTSGEYAIIDFKTGAGKTRKQIDAGFEQQLPLLAWIARDGTLKIGKEEADTAGPVGEFGYVEVRAKFDAKPITHSAEDAEMLINAAKDTLIALIHAYREPDAVFLSAPRVLLKSKYVGDFDRLARRDEWASDIAGEDTR